MTALEPGQEYVAIGPLEGSKHGPPPRVIVIALDEAAGHYDVDPITPRATARVIKVGCEPFWQPAQLPSLTPADGTP